MKRIFTLLIIGFFALTLNAQHAEKAPYANTNYTPINSKALWNMQFSFNATNAASGDVGMAAVAFVNNEFWVSRWASDTLYRFSSSGVLISEFVISGISSTRSITTDGVYLYIGNATNTIYIVNPTNQTQVLPSINSQAASVSRFLTYDSTLDNGNGGFWTGNFNTDIEAIRMNGTVISSIPQTTHTLGGMYGAAVDNLTPGGPFLWVFHQGGANSCQITALDLVTGTPSTTYDRDAYSDLSATYSLASGLAGGLFFTNSFAAGTNTLVALLQSSPGNVIVAYEIDVPVGVEENKTSKLNIYPNPTSSNLNIILPNSLSSNSNIELRDLSGRIVYSDNNIIGQSNIIINTSSIVSGIYFLTVNNNNQKLVEKVVIQ